VKVFLPIAITRAGAKKEELMKLGVEEKLTS